MSWSGICADRRLAYFWSALMLTAILGLTGGSVQLVHPQDSPITGAVNQNVTAIPGSLTGSSPVPESILERGRYLVEGPAHCFTCHSRVEWEGSNGEPSIEEKGAGRIWLAERFPLLPEQEDLTGRDQWLGFQLRRQALISPNITPDPETGAGNWSDETWRQAIREGVGQDGRTLSPAMPSQQFRKMSDEDLASVISYLRSIPARQNPLPARVLSGEILSKLHPLESVTEPVPVPDFSDPINRGAYLVGLSNCRGCHSSFDEDFRPITELEFAGGSLLKGPWGEVTAPNLTSDRNGSSRYDVKTFIQVMRTGRVGKRSLNPVMPWASFRNMSDEDLTAIFAYLQTLKPTVHRVDNAVSPTLCSRCGKFHGDGDRNN
ncbi:MAG: cytochrome c [Acidobacteriota bacterium]